MYHLNEISQLKLVELAEQISFHKFFSCAYFSGVPDYVDKMHKAAKSFQEGQFSRSSQSGNVVAM